MAAVTARIAASIENEILALWPGGKHSTGQIADRFGISRTTVQRALRRNGISFDPEATRLHKCRTSPEQDSEIVARYLAGESGEGLAREFGFRTHASIHQRVRAAGHQVRRPGQPERELTDEEGREVLRLRGEGLSQEKIGMALHIGQDRISRWMIANGIRTWPLSRHPAYSGGPVKMSGGYLGRKVAEDDPLAQMAGRSGYVRENRYVMAQALGRPLARSETVHHVNGDKADNRIGNLQLRQGNHGKGARFTCLDCGSHNVHAALL
jgi:DNA-binding CsgD family transcriptional regulator